MRRGFWVITGFMLGFTFFGVAALIILVPEMRGAFREALCEGSSRLSTAIRAGVRAAREREDQLERELTGQERGLGSDRPDYVV